MVNHYWNLWAKTSKDGRWHALPCHLLDVAAVAEQLWDRLPPPSRESLDNLIGGKAEIRKVLAFLAAAHDIGKANQYFQAKDAQQTGRLRALGYTLQPNNEPQSHGQATGAYLAPWLESRWNWQPQTACFVALAVGGHHGTFFDDTKQTTLRIKEPPWSDIGSSLLDDIAQTLEIDPPPEPVHWNPFLAWLAGFVSVADWLGSHERMTVWQMASVSLAEYLVEARIRAWQLLDSLGWVVPPSTPVLPIVELFSPVGSLNPLQKLATRIAPSCQFAIVEAPTGEGKTEAAFSLTEPARSVGGGVFFALPTMATSNGLFGRVNAYLKSATGSAEPLARLLHSQAWLFRDQFQIVSNPGSEGNTQEQQSHDWFAGSKRGLLAPFGVGTIDQALIASLRARHGFVRLFALAGKTIVIDEVHAYDVYMADLLDVLLGWLRALGSRVILLSATLPKSRRAALLKAWNPDTDPGDGAYPCITWIDDTGSVHSEGFSIHPRKPLSFRLISHDPEMHWRAGAVQLLKQVSKQGGVGALVVNTVRDAQAAFQWLRSNASEHIELHLFHARFTAHDRNAIEQLVLRRFGKGPRPQGPAILVATQVVEQSLDLDFDHMVSSLAPIDLLIQRAGRLHRHRRTISGQLQPDGRPDERPDPVLFVIEPPVDGQGLPLIEDPVYAPDVLMRTLGHLQSSPRIESPSQISAAIEAVYSERDRATSVSQWEQRLKELEERTKLRTQHQFKQAKAVSICSVDNEDCLIVETGIDLDENDERQNSQLAARTRLEDRPSVSVALIRSVNGQLQTIHNAAVDDLRQSVFASLSISPPYPVWEALLNLEPLPEWKNKGQLARTRPLLLEGGKVDLGGYEIRYDSITGLEWRKLDADIQD